MSDDNKPFWKRLHETNWLQPLISLTSLIIAVFGIFLSIFAGCRASKSQQATLGYLKSLDSLFADANKQLSLLPTSVTEFRGTVQGMSDIVIKERQTFQGVFTNLNEWLSTLKSTFVSYDTVLGKVVKATDKQLILLSQKQELLEKELLRKPNLVLDTLEIIADTGGRTEVLLQVFNTGNDIAEFCSILLMVPDELDFQSTGFKQYPQTKRPQQWSYKIPEEIYYETKPGRTTKSSRADMKFSMRLPPGRRTPVMLDYTLYHNRGTNEGKLIITLPSR